MRSKKSFVPVKDLENEQLAIPFVYDVEISDIPFKVFEFGFVPTLK